MNIKTLSLNVLLLWSGLFLAVSATVIVAPGQEAPYEASDGYNRMKRTLDKRTVDLDPASGPIAIVEIS